MKFLCDNCKAKYQIADEKVAGKTVRMKCRKCGHQIEVRAAVTETSVTGLPPQDPEPARGAAPKGGLATSLSAAKPPRAASTSSAPSALAGAFQRNVQDAGSSPPSAGSVPSALDLSVSNEWYVAINGVPVGPVRISELRRKAATGAVTEDSLCWQEGLEEWRPVRSMPELAAIVREAALGNRASLVSPEPSRPPPPPPPRASAVSRPTPEPTRPLVPSPPAPPAPAPSRSNVVPLRPAASMEDNLTAPLNAPAGPLGGAGSAAVAFAPPATAAMAPMPLGAPTPAPLAVTPPAPAAIPDPFALPPQATSPALAPMASASLVPPPPEQTRKGPPLWFWPVLAVALGFGGGVAYLAFRPQPTPQPVVIQMPPTATTPTATADKGDVPPPAPLASAAEAPSVSATAPAKPVAVAKGGPAAPAATPEKKTGIDLGNLVPGAGGPSVNANAGPAGGGGGGLDQAAVERVAANHRAGVKRTCWERGGADQKSSVNVVVTATVAPNGSVSSTSSSGDDPVVGKCIETQVKSWQFPAPGETKTLQLPFKFVRQ